MGLATTLSLWGLGLWGAKSLYDQLFGEGASEGMSEEELKQGLENSPMDMEEFINSPEGQALLQQAQAVGQAQGAEQAPQQGNQFQRDPDTPMGRSNQLYAEASQMPDTVKSGTRTLPNREKQLRQAMAHTETLQALKDSQMRTRDFDKAKSRWDRLGMDRSFNELSEEEKQKFSDGVKHGSMKWNRADWENPQPTTTSNSTTPTATDPGKTNPADPSTLDKIKDGIKSGFDTVKEKMLPKEGEGTVLKPKPEEKPISEIFPRPPSKPDSEGMGPEFYRQRPPGDFEEPVPSEPAPSTPVNPDRNPNRVGPDGKIKPFDLPDWMTNPSMPDWMRYMPGGSMLPPKEASEETVTGTMGGAFDAGDVGMSSLDDAAKAATYDAQLRSDTESINKNIAKIKDNRGTVPIGPTDPYGYRKRGAGDGTDPVTQSLINPKPQSRSQVNDMYGPGEGFGPSAITELPDTDPFGDPLDPNAPSTKRGAAVPSPRTVAEYTQAPPPKEFSASSWDDADVTPMPLAPGQKEFIDNSISQGPDTPQPSIPRFDSQDVTKVTEEILPSHTEKPEQGIVSKPIEPGVLPHRGRYKNRPLDGPPQGAFHKAPGRPEGVVFNDPKARKAERDRVYRETMAKVPIVSVVNGKPQITGYKTRELMRQGMGGKRVKFDPSQAEIDAEKYAGVEDPFGGPSGYAKFDGTIPKMNNGQVNVPKNSNVAASSDFDDPLEKKRKKRLGQIA